jgi:hypothetical protein
MKRRKRRLKENQPAMRIVALLLLFASLHAVAQNNGPKVQFSVGLLHRITPVDINRDSNYIRHNTYINRDDQLTSGGLSLGVSYRFSPLFYAQYNQIVRYGYIHGGDLSLYSNALTEKHKGFMTDFQLSAYRKFAKGNAQHFLLGVGYMLANRGTRYNYQEKLPGGGSAPTPANLNFSAASLSLGYRLKERFQLELLNYIVQKANFHETNSFILFEGRASYIIAPLKKK